MVRTNELELDNIEEALRAFIRIAKKPRLWEEYTIRAKVDIDRPSATILLILSYQALTFQTLVNHLGIEAPSVSRKVHELESQGLIIRAPSDDRRIHQLQLSPSGKQVTEEIRRAERSVLSEVLTGWSAQERRQLVGLLTRLTHNMGHVLENSKKIDTRHK